MRGNSSDMKGKLPHIACLVSDGFAARLLLKSGVARESIARGASVTVIAPNAAEPYFLRECAEHGVALLQAPQTNTRTAQRFRRYRPYFLNDIMGNTALKIGHFRKSQDRPVIGSLLAAMNRIFKGNSLIGRIYRLIELGTNRSQLVKQFLNELNADLLVIANPFGAEEVIYLLHAKELGIPVVCELLSWDNVTAKGTPLMMPDYFISWGPIMTEEIVEYYGFPRERIVECGAPHFDVYRQKDKLASPEVVLDELGLQSGDPYLVFGMVTPYVCQNELDLLMWLAHKVNNNQFAKACSLVIRPHPHTISGYYARTSQEIERLKCLTGPRVALHVPEVLSEQLANDMPGIEMQRLASLLAGCAVCINAGSTLCLDACLVDRPAITIAFDGWERLSYMKSASCGPDYIHMRKLLSYGGVRIARCFDELEHHINTYLMNQGLDQEGRALSVSQECGVQDGRATERVAATLVKLSQGKSQSPHSYAESHVASHRSR